MFNRLFQYFAESRDQLHIRVFKMHIFLAVYTKMIYIIRFFFMHINLCPVKLIVYPIGCKSCFFECAYYAFLAIVVPKFFRRCERAASPV